MDQSSLCTDEDRDSLFGSPPPSTVRGRSPSEETSIEKERGGPMVAVPSTGVGRKNVGTIALPGSHMSCAELPADLPALGLSAPPRPTPSQGLRRSASETLAPLYTPIVASHSPLRSVSSGASFVGSTIPSTSASASIRKRRTSKALSLTPASPPPPITLPAPDEPTPPNFLRSQSSLLGLAGLVGSVKPARLHTQGPQPASAPQRSPVRGSTPAHPIVLDDDHDPSHIGEQLQIAQHLEQLDPDVFRSNIMNSLTKEKNIFPVLESLIKLLGGDPHSSSTNPPLQSFARPYGHGIFKTRSSSAAISSVAGGSITVPQKRRKLKHVPAGAVDWDVPFPFAVGEGPKGYRDTWAQDRAKQLVTQLLELVRDATKRAAVKTTKSRQNASEEWVIAQNRQWSKSAPSEAHRGKTRSPRASASRSSSHPSPSPECTTMGMSSNATPVDSQHLGPSGLPRPVDLPDPSSKDRIFVDLEDVVAACSVVPCDYPAFEEWLSQLQQLVPLETDAPALEPDRDTRLPAPSNPSASGLVSSTCTPTQCNAVLATQMVRDEEIDPVLLALSQLGGPAPQFQSPTSSAPTPASSNISQAPDIHLTPPMLTHSPRTSLSSLSGPLTPLSETFADPPTSSIVHRNHDRGSFIDLGAEEGRPSRTLLTKLFEPPYMSQAQKGNMRADMGATSATPSTSSRSTPSMVLTSKGVLDKQAILEHARERRERLVTELERAKMEIWETSIENAVLVQLMKDGSLRS